ncbi:MAG: hypothetical protein QOD60_20 [Solirubrobacterales bacterium]|nr:hypothetical protein [Solirubrobacterales bacterium]
MESSTTSQGPDARAVGEEFERLFYSSMGQTWAGVEWLGVRALKLPLDLWVMQEIVTETRPDLIIETGVAEGGSTLFFASILDLLGGNGRVIGVDVDLSKVDARVRSHPRVTLIEGGSTDARVLAQLGESASGRRVMVNLDSDHTALHVSAELRALSPLVGPGCYLVVEDTIVNGNPVEPDFGPGPAEALETWLGTNPPFEVDRGRERLLATFNPGGYLRRVGDLDQPPPAAPRPGPAAAAPPARPVPEAPSRSAVLAETRAAVAELVADGSSVLELGCGAGEMAALLRERGCTVTGVEADPELAAQAEEVCDPVHRLVLDDPELDTALGDRRFDAIVAVHALEHGGPRLLELAHRHLAREGRLVLAVANAAHTSARLELLAGRLPNPGGRPYTLDSLDEELAAAGFALARVERQLSPAPELGAGGGTLDRAIAAELAGDVEAATLTLVALAVPLPRADLEVQRQRIAALARRCDELEQRLAALTEIESREGEAREELAGARAELAEQRPELDSMREALRRSSTRVSDLRDSLTAATTLAEAKGAESDRLGLRIRHLEAELVSTQSQLEEKTHEATRLRTRLARILRLPPFRLYHALRRYPPLSWIAARRARRYRSDLERASSDL